MTDAGDPGTRTRRALLANLRQQLLTPASALVEYGELLQEAARESGRQEMTGDLERILAAAHGLSQIVNNLLDDTVSQEIFGGEDLHQAERKLRHDLRTPINAIKGYGEMLLEDLEDFSAEHMREDLDKLLTEANRLQSDLDVIVRFSRPGEADASDLMQQGETAISKLIGSIEHVDESTLRAQTGQVLVVDDIEANRDLLSRRLIKDGHRAALAADGMEALLMLEQEEFDLVLLDICPLRGHLPKTIIAIGIEDEIRINKVTNATALPSAKQKQKN